MNSVFDFARLSEVVDEMFEGIQTLCAVVQPGEEERAQNMAQQWVDENRRLGMSDGAKVLAAAAVVKTIIDNWEDKMERGSNDTTSLS